MKLTPEQLNNLLNGHCHRVLDNLNHDDLYNYALQMMKESYDKNPGCGDTSQEMLVADIFIAEDQDEDSVYEFLIGSGVEDEKAMSIVNNYQA